MPLYALTIFLSAFLLFQVQPIIAKTILAWFGGSAAVWTTCMLFFQSVLLLGYLYAHFSIRKLTPKTQMILHVGLLGVCALLLPVIPDTAWKPTGTENPTIRILLLLAATIGLPYMLLSTTGPLLQAWYSRAEKGAMPYRLFALSNLGSALALLSYPPLVEPYLSGRLQAWVWSGAFGVFALLCALTAYRSSKFPPLEQQEAAGATTASSDAGGAPPLLRKLLWVALAACPSALMLAVTNHVTQDVASIPFLWILPLTIYLLSFILTFDAGIWYRRNIFLVLLAPALGGMSYLQWSNAKSVDFRWTIAAFAASLFVACMVCHGELAARKPAPRHLTSFYLMLSVGGALGGLFVGVIAPYLFISYFELPFTLIFCGLLAWVVAVDEPGLSWKKTAVSFSSLSLLSGVIGLSVFLIKSMGDAINGYRIVQRNFYGTLRVRENRGDDPRKAYRTLLHGAINHGEQWVHPERRREPLTYYCEDAGIGRAMQTRKNGVPAKIGVLGLGAGTMAAFGRKGDEIRFYEINPLVPVLAKSLFSFVPDSYAKVDVVMGDARLSLERESPQSFDVMLVDVFSGDSIPVHLLTREAIQLYFRHLHPSGVIVIHISNKYLNLQPVIARVADNLGKAALLVESDEDESGDCFGTTYVLLANNAKVFEHPAFKGSAGPPAIQNNIPMWTDDYSNLFRILK
jgi:hypothetical protein